MKTYLHQVKPCSPSVRIWPYPYLAGLSISNDAEFMSLDFFEMLMSFLNTKNFTPLGNGLGLDVSSSFFFYSAHSYNFSYFKGYNVSAPPEEYSSRLNEYLKSGWIDTIHAYGDFDVVGGFIRPHAIRCFETISRIGVTVPIFTNHGGVENVQNIGLDAEYHQGDRPDSPAYHTDLLAQNGVRYIWTDSMVTQRLQKRSFSSRFSHFVRDRIKKGQKYSSQPTQITSSVSLQDNSNFIGFPRFRSTGTNAPNFSSLGYQLQQIPWNQFYETHRAIVLYQHLGVLFRYAGKCVSASIDAIRERPQVYLAPFYFLQQESQSGRLWVAGLADFLNYVNMIQTTTLIESDGCYHLHNPSHIEQVQKFYQGLTFYINSAQSVRILSADRELELDYNGPDETGRYSVSVRAVKKPSIW